MLTELVVLEYKPLIRLTVFCSTNNLFVLSDIIELTQSTLFLASSMHNYPELLISFSPTEYTGLVKCTEKVIKVP
jgi:hypothetical protein